LHLRLEDGYSLSNVYIGMDTNGGVRIPGGFCGIFGFRPSHAAVSTIGVLPVSPSLDTPGT